MGRNYKTFQLSSTTCCSFERRLEIISSVQAFGPKYLSSPIFVVSPPSPPENNIELMQPLFRQSLYLFVVTNQI